jgi:tetratricopeptide (TPR) repeat protein
MILFSDMTRLTSKAAVERYVADRFEGDPAKLATEINKTINRLLHTDLKKAGRFISRVERCFKHLPTRYRPRFVAMEARYAHWTGRSKAASRKYERAIAQMQSYRDYKAAAQTRLGLMDVYMYLGRYDDALRIGKRALAYFRAKKNDTAAARAMTNIGNVYHRMDRNKLALRYYDQARKFLKRDGGVPLAIVDYNRANILSNLNRLDQAETLYRSSADIYRRSGMAILACKAEYSLAYLYFLADRYTEAIVGFEKVYDALQSLGDARTAAITQLDLAEINIQLNQFGSAVMIGEQIIPTFKRFGLRYEQAKAAYFVAEAFLRLGDSRDAGRYLDCAKRLFICEGNRLWQGMVSLMRCRLNLTTHRYGKALQLAAMARRFFDQSGDERRKADAEIALVEAQLQSGRGMEAYRRGKRLLDRRLVSHQRHTVYYLLGQYYLRKSRPEIALNYFNQAIDIVEKMLTNLYPDEVRFFFALDKYATYLAAVQCLQQLNRTEESLSKYSRALAVLNQRRVPNSGRQRGVPTRLLEIRANLRASLKKLGRIPHSDQRRIGSAPTMYQIEHRLWAHERKIRSQMYPAKSIHRLSAGKKHLYSGLLREDEALVTFVITEETVGAFHTHLDHTEYVSCPVTPQLLETTIRELYFLMEKTVYAPGRGDHSYDVVIHYLLRLFNWLIAPLNLTENRQKLILLVDGIFAQIPFPALRDSKGRWLKDRFNIRLIANPDDLRPEYTPIRLTARHRSAIFAPSTVGLPLIEVEGQEIKGMFPKARFYAGDKTTCRDLKYELGQVEGFIHIATHASRSSENPLFSRILMNDGPFFPFDLFGIDVSAQLITLSGCQTAGPGIYYGNSFSLAKAFYQGGARFVLASLWSVSDKVSMLYMTEFYKALKKTVNVSTAYFKALDEVMIVNENPAFWSPFVLLGL